MECTFVRSYSLLLAWILFLRQLFQTRMMDRDPAMEKDADEDADEDADQDAD